MFIITNTGGGLKLPNLHFKLGHSLLFVLLRIALNNIRNWKSAISRRLQIALFRVDNLGESLVLQLMRRASFQQFAHRLGIECIFVETGLDALGEGVLEFVGTLQTLTRCVAEFTSSENALKLFIKSFSVTRSSLKDWRIYYVLLRLVQVLENKIQTYPSASVNSSFVSDFSQLFNVGKSTSKSSLNWLISNAIFSVFPSSDFMRWLSSH